MRSAVIVGPIAATTEYWEETQADGTRETGCRVQLRRVRETKPPVPPPQPRRDAVFWSIEEPIWRADLFTTVGSGTAFDAAHYHPTFTGLVPCERVGDPAIEADPFGWIEGRLGNVPGMLAEAGYPDLARELDPEALRQAMPAILATIRATSRSGQALPSRTEAPIVAGPPPGGARRLRVAVAGLSHYHVTGWVETIEGFPDELEIVALYDPDPERARTLAPSHHDPSLRAGLGEAYRAIPVETSLADLVDRHALDVALVTLPNARAPEAIERLARAGIHLLVDKPAARSAAEARQAFTAVRDAGVRAVVGLTRRYSPAARLARELVVSGRLGPLVTAEAVFAASSVRVRDPANPLFDPDLSGGGILSWLGIHDIDCLLWLTGEPVVEVSAMTGRVGSPGLAVEDVVSVALRLAGGAVATVHHAYALPARGYRSRLALRGLDASLELGLDEELVLVTAGQDGDRLDEERTSFDVPPAPGYGASGRAAVRDLLDAIRDNREPEASGDALVDALEVIDAAYDSARTGRHIRLT